MTISEFGDSLSSVFWRYLPVSDELFSFACFLLGAIVLGEFIA